MKKQKSSPLVVCLLFIYDVLPALEGNKENIVYIKNGQIV
jgi:hypothetical protein